MYKDGMKCQWILEFFFPWKFYVWQKNPEIAENNKIRTKSPVVARRVKLAVGSYISDDIKGTAPLWWEESAHDEKL